jgi:hypothetical protein
MRCCIVFGFLLSCALHVPQAAAQPSTPFIAALADLNADCVPDTVRVRNAFTGDSSWIKIYWGQRDTSGGCDSDWYANVQWTFTGITSLNIDGFSRQRFSVFTIPNNDDAYRDLVVNVYGLFSKEADDDTTLADTSFTLVVYAQRGIDTLPSLSLSPDNETHDDPVIYRGIQRGRDIKVQDSSQNGWSYTGKLLRIELPTNVPTPSALMTTSTFNQGPERSYVARVSRVVPNPVSGDVVDIYLTGVTPPYHVSLVSVDGTIVHSQSLPQWTLSNISVSIRSLTSGVYSVRVMGADGLCAFTEFIVIR